MATLLNICDKYHGEKCRTKQSQLHVDQRHELFNAIQITKKF